MKHEASSSYNIKSYKSGGTSAAVAYRCVGANASFAVTGSESRGGEMPRPVKMVDCSMDSVLGTMRTCTEAEAGGRVAEEEGGMLISRRGMIDV